MDALRLKGTKMDSGERARVDLENDPCIPFSLRIGKPSPFSVTRA